MKLQSIFRAVIFIGGLLLAFLIFSPEAKPPHVAQATGCSVELFDASPGSPVSVETIVSLHGRGNCSGGVRAVKFQINGIDRAEIAQPEQWENWLTAEWGAGNYNVCFLVAGGSDGTWEAGTSSCKTYEVTGAPSGVCQVDTFSVSPSSGDVGTVFTLAGSGSCNIGVRAVRFLIDGIPFGEIGSPAQSTPWDSSGYSAGDHTIVFQVTAGDWSQAATATTTVNLGSLPPQPNNCRVELFNANPGSPVLIGTQVQLHGRGNCDGGVRAVKFQINGVNRAEIAQPEQWETWRTNEFGVGTYNVCFWVAGGADGRWEAGTRSCMLFQVIAEAPQPTPEPGIIRTGNNDANNGCSISSFVLNPASHNYPQGTHVTLTGTSNCGSVRFEVRNVNTNQIWPKAEIGQPNQTETLKTEEFPIGPYEVCFVARSSGGWENADYNCYPAGIGMTYEGTPGGSNTSPTPNLPTNGCPSRASRLHTGDIAVVNTSELNIRNRPGIQQGIPIGAPMQHGAQLTIVGGSVCADGYLWWEIGYNGRSGWSAEVGPNGYLMVPNGTPLTNNPPSQITPTQTPPPTEPISQVTPTRRCFQGGGYNNVTDPNGNHNYVWFSVGTTYNGYPTWAIYPPPNNIYFSLVHHSMNSVPSNGIARVYFQFAVLPYWVLPGADTWLLCSR